MVNEIYHGTEGSKSMKEEEIQHHLENTLKTSGFSDLTKEMMVTLLGIVQGETLGNKVTSAVNQRKQGHFDSAVLHITEANRDHMLAVRKVQSILDDIRAVPRRTVILEKFRQVYPFQIGLTDGEDVLALLMSIAKTCDSATEEGIAALHRAEMTLGPLLEELDVYKTRLSGRIPEAEVRELAHTIQEEETSLLQMKIALVNDLCGYIQEKYAHTTCDNKISLLQSLYTILTSAIETLDAKFVDV